MASPIQLIVGLANPGDKYAKTRHNAGAWLVEQLAQQQHLSWRLDKKLSVTLTDIPHPQLCRLAIPLNYMNHNGSSVQAIANYYRIPASAILIVHDELDLAPGLARIKQGGGAAGHNGLNDVIRHLNTPDFLRLRIGIGRSVISQQDTADYVLSSPTRTEATAIQAAIDAALNIIPLLIAGNIAAAMQQLHTNLTI